jgi:sodium/bile acid cotransporter 7
MAGVLFPAGQLGLILLPVMLFHQLQLIACAMIAPRLGARAERDLAGQSGSGEPAQTVVLK